MGLTVEAKGLSYDDSYDCGYITFGRFRMALAKAYNEELGELYYKFCHGTDLTEEEWNRWDELSNEGLDIFLFHSDGDGKFTPQECRKIYNAIKDLKLDMWGHNYLNVKTFVEDGKILHDVKQYNMLEQWKNMFKHCYKRRVNMYFR